MKKNVIPIFPAAKPRPEAITKRIEYCDTVRTGSRQRLAQAIVRSVGAEGLRRIRDNALDRLWKRKLATALQDAYDRFRQTYRLPSKGTPGRFASKGDAFASRLGLSNKGHLHKYLNGEIINTPPLKLDQIFKRAGVHWSQVLPSDEEQLRAIMSDTIAAMMKARGIPPSGVLITDADLAQIIHFQSIYPVPTDGFASDAEWWDYLRMVHQAIDWMVLQEQSSEEVSRSLTATIHTLVVQCGDWQVARRYLVPQLIVATATLMRLMEASASSAIRHGSAKRCASRERALTDKIVAKLQERVYFLWELDKRCDPVHYAAEPTIQLADVLVMSGRYRDALEPLRRVANEYEHHGTHLPHLRTSIERIVNEILSMHGEDAVDSLRPPNLVQNHEREYASIWLRMIMESLGMLAGQNSRIGQV